MIDNDDIRSQVFKIYEKSNNDILLLQEILEKYSINKDDILGTFESLTWSDDNEVLAEKLWNKYGLNKRCINSLTSLVVSKKDLYNSKILNLLTKKYPQQFYINVLGSIKEGADLLMVVRDIKVLKILQDLCPQIIKDNALQNSVNVCDLNNVKGWIEAGAKIVNEKRNVLNSRNINPNGKKFAYASEIRMILLKNYPLEKRNEDDFKNFIINMTESKHESVLREVGSMLCNNILSIEDIPKIKYPILYALSLLSDSKKLLSMMFEKGIDKTLTNRLYKSAVLSGSIEKITYLTELNLESTYEKSLGYKKLINELYETPNYQQIGKLKCVKFLQSYYFKNK